MSLVISQSSCLTPIHNTLHFRNHSHSHIFPSKVLMARNDEGHVIKGYSLASRLDLTYRAAVTKSHNDIITKTYSSTVDHVNGEEIVEPVENVVSEQKPRSAKIHDFCFGIPFGGIVFSGGLIGFAFSRNSASLITGGLYGGALLALSILSLKIWRQGHSSLPFILGQAGIAAALLWKNVQTYSLTKKIIPTGFHIVLSAAMLCFYTYVMLSGGNPTPKKSKSTAASQS